MSAFLENPWVVGILGGIVSGLVVWVATNFLFSKRENREYRQNLASANREVIYALRPTISEGVIPDARVMGALIGATARKYQVIRSDMNSVSQVVNDLIKEVMDSSFIPAKTKSDFCSQLTTLKESEKQRLEERRSQVAIVASPASMERRKMEGRLLSNVLALTAAMMTLAMGLILSMSTLNQGSYFKSFYADILLAALIPTVVVLIAVLLSAFLIRRDLLFRKRTSASDSSSPSNLPTSGQSAEDGGPPVMPQTT